MSYLNFKLTLLLIVTAPLIALIVYIAGKRLKKLAKRIKPPMGDVTHIASEAVDGHLEIKSFNAQDYENTRFLEANSSNKNQNLKLEGNREFSHTYYSNTCISFFISCGLFCSWLSTWYKFRC
jgi:subfamily B ATP-binding cassette protein MsbA